MASPAKMRTIDERGRASARRDGLMLALLYGTVAGLWIMFSDRALALIGLPLMTERFVSAVKGEVFVVVTASALYLFTVRHLRRLYASEDRYHRMFEHTTLGLIVMRVRQDAFGIGLTIEDVNPAQAMRMGRSAYQLIGWSSDSPQHDPRMRAYFDIVRDAVAQERPLQTELHLPDEELDELLAAYPIEDCLYVLGVRDVSDLRRAQDALRAQDEWIRAAYVDVLDAVTGGKLILLSENEIEDALGDPLLHARSISRPEELGEARAAVEGAIEGLYPALAQSMELMNSFGEAVNNVLKHAGRGTYAVFLRQGIVQVCISDEGPGIDFRTLPKATLVSGFSTTQTLGLGFTIMLQLCDRVMISTRPGRTTIVLELSPSSVSAPLTPERFTE